MYLRYGTYTHPLAEPTVAIRRAALFSPAGQWWATRERWDISGIVGNPAGTPAAMKTKLAALEAAYATGGKDVALLLPDRSRSTHYIRNTSAIGGVKIVQPLSYPQGQGAEHVTYRTFTVSLEAILPISTGRVVLAFEETISVSGGGPRYGYIETRTGPPVKQLLAAATVCRATQSGRAVGLFHYPTVPQPLFPGSLIGPGDVQYRSPRRDNGDYAEYEVSWQYQFESASRMLTTPHRWTI